MEAQTMNNNATVKTTPQSKSGAWDDNSSIFDQVQQVNTARSNFYQMLASLCYQELTVQQIIHMRSISFADLGESKRQTQGYLLMQKGLRGYPEKVRQDLACDYAHTFLAAGEYDDHCAVPYESVYTSKNGLLMQQAREDARKEYLKHHVEVHTKGFEPEDHISFEMDFMAHLAKRCNEALDTNDRKKVAELMQDSSNFLKNHLLNWVDDLCDAIEKSAQTPFYKGAGIVLSTFIHDDADTVEDIYHAIV